MSVSDDGMDGKIALITGATNGIGRITALALAQRGATVVIVARDTNRAKQTAEEVRSKAPGSIVHTLIADLSSQRQVRRLAAEYQAQFSHLDVLINNAGAVFAKRKESIDGIEMTLAVNHLAPFLLTNLLLDSLKASNQARIITVASAAHMGMRIPFDDLNHERGRYQSFVVYGQTKLMNIMFTYELARRLEGLSVTANALHPGFVATNFGKSNGGWWETAFTLAQPFAISPTKGAQTSIYLASSSQVETVTGKYFTNCKAVKSSPASYDREAQERLWTVSEELTARSSNSSA
jgi:NAD(P)-dependent dehydrogenase (short-subunit alcohol dehydrogenase family)